MLKITKKALKATQKSVNLGINLRILSQTSFNSGKADKRERERERERESELRLQGNPKI